MGNEQAKKIDVEFNEALRRIAHTPKEVINDKKQEKEEAEPPPIDDSAKLITPKQN